MIKNQVPIRTNFIDIHVVLFKVECESPIYSLVKFDVYFIVLLSPKQTFHIALLEGIGKSLDVLILRNFMLFS